MDVTIDSVDGPSDQISVCVTDNDWERRGGLVTAMDVIVPRSELPGSLRGPLPRSWDMDRAHFDELCRKYGRRF